MQSSFFDLGNRHKKLDEKDKLVWLNEITDWEAFRETLKKSRKKTEEATLAENPLMWCLCSKP